LSIKKSFDIAKFKRAENALSKSHFENGMPEESRLATFYFKIEKT